jgi:hypothetical protein
VRGRRPTKRRGGRAQSTQGRGMPASTPTPVSGGFDPAALARVVRQPEFETMFLGEPDLLFGERRTMPDPKTGLALYGPYDLTDEGRPSRIRLGIVGTGATIDLARRWIDRCRSKVMPTRLVKRAGALEQDSSQLTQCASHSLPRK